MPGDLQGGNTTFALPARGGRADFRDFVETPCTDKIYGVVDVIYTNKVVFALNKFESFCHIYLVYSSENTRFPNIFWTRQRWQPPPG